MIHSSHRDRKTKAIAEALAMIADAHPELDPHRPRPDCDTQGNFVHDVIVGVFDRLLTPSPGEALPTHYAAKRGRGGRGGALCAVEIV